MIPARLSGLAAARPDASAAAGARFLATDTNAISFSTGAAWFSTDSCPLEQSAGYTSGDLSARPDSVTMVGWLYRDESDILYEAFPGEWVTLGSAASSEPFDVTGTVTKAVAATGTLTSNNTNVANNATVTIGNKTYTFKTALTPTEGEVLIGADADASLLNLIRAINHTGTPDTDYKCAAAHTQVTAAASVTAHAFAITSIVTGTAGNAYATTETSATLSFGAATMTGGVQTPSPTLLSEALVGAGRKVMVQGFLCKVDGATAWDEAASVALADTDIVTFATILKAALSGNAYVVPTTSNLGAGMVTGGGSGRGLIIAPSGNEDTGDDLLVRVWGLIVAA
jgi:hypothetical protein